MALFVSNLASAGVQVIVFALLPLAWWLIFHRQKVGVFQWLGLKGVPRDKVRDCVRWSVAVMVLSAPLPILIFRVLRGVPSATSQFAGLGLGALPGALVFAFLQTGLSEEILFRGFLLKRLAVRFGFGAGNMVQSVIFGAIHGLGFFTSVGWFWALLITLFTGISAWFMGYINEKKADGSIMPSWIMHGVSKVLSSLMSMVFF